MNHLEPIIASSSNRHDETNIDCDDEYLVASVPSDFQHGNDPFHKLLSQR